MTDPLDLLHLGDRRRIGAYLLDTDDGLALFDCGPTTCIPALHGALGERGVELGDTEEIETIAAWMRMSPSAVRAAIGYYTEFPDEIDAWVRRNEEVGDQHRAAWRAERGLPPE